MRATAIVNARVFDGRGNIFENGVVLVKGSLIADVGSAGSVEIPPEARILDVGGSFVMPGLIDSHLHLVGMRTGDFVKEPLLVPYDTFVARVVRDLEALVEAGFTTVGDAGSLIAVRLKPALAEGTIRGPRVVAAGLTLSPTFGHGDAHYLPLEYVDARTSRLQNPLASLICDGVSECRKAARYALREGADFVKIMATGGVLSQRDRPEYRQFTLEEIKAIVEEAEAAGKFVHAHAQGTEGIRNSLLGGVKVIAHAIFIDEECVELAKEKDAVIVPTFSIVEKILSVGPKIGIPEWGLRKAEETSEAHLENIRRAYKRGAVIALGTDFCGGPFAHGENALELKILVEKVGMSPKDALIAATANSAKAVGLDRITGTLEKGKLADLIVVRGNPLEDVNTLLNTRNIAMVWRDGGIVKGKRGGLRR